MVKRAIAVIISAFVFAGVLAGCGSKSPQDAAPAQNVQAGTDAQQEGKGEEKEAKSEGTQSSLIKCNIGYLASTGHVLYFIAQEKGYFKEEGLDTELFLFNNSGEGLNAIIAGKLDTGSFGTAPPLTFISKGSDLTIFGGQMSEGHAIIAKPEKADELKDIKNFKGKKLATVRLATGDIVFRGAFTDAGIDWKNDLVINEMESPAAVLEAVKKGSVDAGVVWTPYRKMAEDQGLKIVQFSGEVEDMKDHPCCRQVALTARIKEDPEKYEKLQAALIKAYKFYKTNQEETLDILSKYVKIDKEVLKAETYGEHISSNPDPNKEGVVKSWDFMKKIGYITPEDSLKIEDHINTEIYSNALDRILKDNPDDAVYKQLKADFKE